MGFRPEYRVNHDNFSVGSYRLGYGNSLRHSVYHVAGPMNTPDCLLECGCYQRIRIDLAISGRVTTCVTHGQTYICQVLTHEWHTRCQTYGCRYGRWLGQNEQAARLVNGRHATLRNHLGGVAYDRITWDGRGSIYRDSGQRATDRAPKAPPKAGNDTVTIVDYDPPPF